MKNENHIEFGAKLSDRQLSLKDSSLWNAMVSPLVSFTENTHNEENNEKNQKF